MKNQVSQFVKQLGGSTAYSGKNKAMYITGIKSDEIEYLVFYKFGYSLPFRITSKTHYK